MLNLLDLMPGEARRVANRLLGRLPAYVKDNIRNVVKKVLTNMSLESMIFVVINLFGDKLDIMALPAQIG